MMETLTIVFAILSLSFFTAYLFTLKRLRWTSNQIAHIISLYQLAQDSNTHEEEQDIHKENFIKFLSDSREWAFEYIENVQDGIGKFISEVDSEIEYFDNYGEAFWTPLSKSMTKISAAYKDLKNLLPQDENA